MKILYISLMLPSFMYAINIPKSSLESVRNNVVNQLEIAQKQKDQQLITKYKSELANLDQKIKHFELEWLQYRKRQLELRKTSTEIKKELSEIEQLIQARK